MKTLQTAILFFLGVYKCHTTEIGMTGRWKSNIALKAVVIMLLTFVLAHREDASP